MPAPDDQRPTDLPRHVGIIMDGNGRWAAARSLPRLEGHRRGAERLIEIVDDCIDLGIGTLTVFAFSAENWKRPPEEISGLFKLGEWVLRAHLARLELRVFYEEWLKRMPTVRIDPDKTVTYRTGLTLALDKVPIVWDATGGSSS